MFVPAEMAGAAEMGLLFVVLLAVCGVAARFHNYFAAGATSVGARFDYWRAACIYGGTSAFGTAPAVSTS